MQFNELDEHVQRIAARLILEGKDRVRNLTQEQFEERLRHYLAVAKATLEAVGPETSNQDSGFQPTFTFIDAFGGERDIKIGFNSYSQKRIVLAKVSHACKVLMAQAGIIRMAATLGDTVQISRAISLNPPTSRDQVKYWEKKMWKWIKAEFGEEAGLGDLPPEYRKDSLVVSVMGPHVKETSIITDYRWEGGVLVFGEDVVQAHAENRMIQKWWE